MYEGLIADAGSAIVAMILLFTEIKLLNQKLHTEGNRVVQNDEKKECIIKPSQKGIIITIAREHGTAGKQIGKIISEELGIPFYYKEVIALAAQECGFDKEFISDINRNSPTIMKELYLSTTVIQQAIIAQRQIIQKIAKNGSCVLVGRAADYVLRENEDVFRIFLYAPKQYKVKKVMEMYGDTETEAYKQVSRADAARAAYYKNISGQTWGEAHNYDLCVDCSRGVEETASAILAYIKNNKR